MLTGGSSNEDLLLVTAAGERYVLRRFLRNNPSAVEAALARLAGVRPMAEVIAADPEGQLAGEPVLLSRFVPGHLVGDILPTLFADEAATLGRSTGAALAAPRRDGNWRISAVLDWEFAFSSLPLFDVGNMLRHDRPAGFTDGFLDGYVAGGGHLPHGWRALSQALDLFALADLVTRPPDHRYFRRAADTLRQLLAVS